MTQGAEVQPIYTTPARWRTWPDHWPVGRNFYSKNTILFIFFYGKLRTKLRLGDRSQEGRLKAPMVKWVGRGSIPSSSSSVLRPRISSLQPMGPVEPTLIFPDQPLWPCWSLSNLEKAAYLSLYENRLVWNLFVKIVHYLLVVSEARVVLRCGFRLSCTSWSSRYPRLWLKSKELFL